MNNTPHFYNGNIKVGDMLTWNKLAGSGTLNGCKGTCGKHCQGCYNTENPMSSPCYVFKSYRQYGDGLINSHIVNTEAIRNDLKNTFEKFKKDLSRKRKIKPIRVHASGEFESVEEIMEWMRLAKQFPDWPIYVYTKAEEYVDEALIEMEREGYPSNFYINISVWHEHGIEFYYKWKHLPFIRAFVYDDGWDYPAAGLKLDKYCPAYQWEEKVLKSGKVSRKVVLKHDLTCDRCRMCFSANNKILGCLSH